MLSNKITKMSAFTEDQILQIIQNIAMGLKEIHASSMPLIHRNICVFYFYLKELIA